MNQKYPQKEHLKRDSEIKYLFDNGKWCSKYPLKVVYCTSSVEISCSKIGVSVSKRNFKRAVDRNYIKRVLRECYRLNKPNFILKNSLVMFVYSGKEILPFHEIQRKYLQLLEKVKDNG